MSGLGFFNKHKFQPTQNNKVMSSPYKNKFENPILLNSFSLVKLSYSPNSNNDFIKVNYFELSSTGNHYIEVDSINVDALNNIIDYTANIDNVVWDRGNVDYFHRINKVQSAHLYTPSVDDIVRDQQFINVEFFIPQLYNWSRVAGIHVIIKGVDTNDVYVSKLLRISDFNISESKQLYYGQFWMESNIIKGLKALFKERKLKRNK